jgi:hypothetical protein
MNLEVWAFETIRDGIIGEREFGAELPRVRALLETYGPGPLKFLLTTLTRRGISFQKVLTDLERTVEILGEAVMIGTARGGNDG